MIFLCAHGQLEGRRCWACGGMAKVTTATGFTDDDILVFVKPRLRTVAQHSLLDKMDTDHKAALITSLTLPLRKQRLA